MSFSTELLGLVPGVMIQPPLINAVNLVRAQSVCPPLAVTIGGAAPISAAPVSALADSIQSWTAMTDGATARVLATTVVSVQSVYINGLLQAQGTYVFTPPTLVIPGTLNVFAGDVLSAHLRSY